MRPARGPYRASRQRSAFRPYPRRRVPSSLQVWEEEEEGVRGDDRRIRATRWLGKMETPGTLQGRIDAMNDFKKAAADAGAAKFGAVAYSYFFIFSERDAVVLQLIVTTLLSAAGAVLAVLLLFLHVGTVLLIAIGIAAVDGGLFIMMAFWAVPLDIGSFICLAIAVGLSVDYVVHVAHAFEHAHGTPAERAVAALHEIGGSVFKGGASTFLGIVLLAGSESVRDCRQLAVLRYAVHLSRKRHLRIPTNLPFCLLLCACRRSFASSSRCW